MNADEQLALTTLHVCDVCKGSRIEIDPETQLERPCRVCQATGLLDYDPEDHTEIPYG